MSHSNVGWTKLHDECETQPSNSLRFTQVHQSNQDYQVHQSNQDYLIHRGHLLGGH